MDKLQDNDQLWAAAPGTLPESTLLSDVSCCDHCGCDMVYPIDWKQDAPVQRSGWRSSALEETWKVFLRCPNCNDQRVARIGDEMIECFDVLLDEGTKKLVSNRNSFERSNFAEYMQNFVRALAADAIFPEDF